jgi:hypothetical protein
MKDFEEELGQALGGLDAPEGFADRVMARVERREWQRRSSRVSRWQLAIAAGLVVVCAGLGGQRVYERHEGEVAAQQFGLAMRVTTRSLNNVDRGLGRLDRTNDAGKGDAQ